jgi:hypothetical protein
MNSTSTAATPRSYRFAPIAKAGMLIGLTGAQVLPIGIGLFAALAALRLHAPFPLPLVPAAGGAALGLGRVHSQPVVEMVPVWMAWGWRRARGRHRWFATIPLTGCGARSLSLPPVLAGLEVIEVPATGASRSRVAGIGLVRDARAGLLTGVLRVHGQQFALESPGDQDRLVALWGDALAPFARERTPVARVVWQEWAAATGVDDHLDVLAEREPDAASRPARAAYEALVTRQAPVTVTHEVLVSVTMDLRRVRVYRSRDGDVHRAAADTLLEELRLFGARLENAGLHVDAPLSPAEITRATRVRSDPRVIAQLSTLARSLGAAAGVTPLEFGPLMVVDDWGHARVDGAAHRAYWFASWPRLERPAAWMNGLLLGGVGCTRTVTVVLEPVAPSRSARSVDRDLVKLETDHDERARKGFRVRARDQRAVVDVRRREQELVAGFHEFAYVGLACVTATDVDALDDAAASYEQQAAQVGVELRSLDGRHAAGWAASLPLGRTLARRVTA